MLLREFKVKLFVIPIFMLDFAQNTLLKRMMERNSISAYQSVSNSLWRMQKTEMLYVLQPMSLKQYKLRFKTGSLISSKDIFRPVQPKRVL